MTSEASRHKACPLSTQCKLTGRNSHSLVNDHWGNLNFSLKSASQVSDHGLLFLWKWKELRVSRSPVNESTATFQESIALAIFIRTRSKTTILLVPCLSITLYHCITLSCYQNPWNITTSCSLQLIWGGTCGGHKYCTVVPLLRDHPFCQAEMVT